MTSRIGTLNRERRHSCLPGPGAAPLADRNVGAPVDGSWGVSTSPESCSGPGQGNRPWSPAYWARRKTSEGSARFRTERSMPPSGLRSDATRNWSAICLVIAVA